MDIFRPGFLLLLLFLVCSFLVVVVSLCSFHFWIFSARICAAIRVICGHISVCWWWSYPSACFSLGAFLWRAFCLVRQFGVVRRDRFFGCLLFSYSTSRIGEALESFKITSTCFEILIYGKFCKLCGLLVLANLKFREYTHTHKPELRRQKRIVEQPLDRKIDRFLGQSFAWSAQIMTVNIWRSKCLIELWVCFRTERDVCLCVSGGFLLRMSMRFVALTLVQASRV